MKRSYIKYIVSMLLFGSNGIVAAHIPLTSYQIVLFRTLIGSLFLSAVFLMSGQRFTFMHNKKDFAFIALSGVSMGASWMFLYEGYAQIGVSISSLLYYCGPVMVMALSPIVFKEKLTAAKAVGFAAVLPGIFLVNGQLSSGGSAWGIFCAFMSAVTYTGMVVFNKKSACISGVENTVIQLVTAFLTVAVFVGLKGGFAMSVVSDAWIWILVLGVLNTGVGCYFYFSSIGSLPVQTVAICGYLELVSAVVFSMIFLKETMNFTQLIGAALIVGGAVFGEYFGRKTKNAPIGEIG